MERKSGQEVSAQKKVEISLAGDARQFEAGGRSVTFVPLSIKRRRYSKVLIPPRGNSNAQVKSSFDLPMIRTLGKAYYWQKLLDTGKVVTVTELAGQLRLETGWVAEVLRLTRLAPDIVQAILEGRQPRHLNLHTLRGRQVEVPVDWREQRTLFGFEASSGS